VGKQGSRTQHHCDDHGEPKARQDERSN
jgi:hypothetical protein